MYPVVINKILCLKNNLIDISRQIKKQKQYQIQFYNCWDQKNEDMYWGQFVKSRNLLGGVKSGLPCFLCLGHDVP